MPIIQGTKVTVEILLDAVAKLTPAELIQFEHGFFALRQQKSLKEKVAHQAKSYQLPKKQQQRLRELLDKNKEGVMNPEEEKELDAILEELDRRNLLLADKILSLAD